MTFLSTRRKRESKNGIPVARGHANRPKFHSDKWPFLTIYSLNDQVLIMSDFLRVFVITARYSISKNALCGYM
jgi:hypothetical protein